MKFLDWFTMLLLASILFAVVGTFFDVITSKEAIMVLAVLGIPLTIATKFLN